MVPVLDTPLLEHVIGYLSYHQIKDIIIVQSRLPQSIEGYLGDGSQFGVKLSYVVEDAPLGTAGAVKNAERYLDETFLVLNGDIFTDLDITAMISCHLDKKAKATIALTPVDDPTSYGLIETNAQGGVTCFVEKPSWSQVTTNMINAGTYVLAPDVLAHIPPQANFSFERELFPLLLEQGEPIYAFPSSAYWIDIGTPEKYLQLNRDLLSGKSSRYAPALNEVLIGTQTNVHPTAQIEAPAVIGGNCSIGRNVKLIGSVVVGTGCEIMEDTVIEDSIIWHNVRLGPRAKLKSSIVADNCCLNADTLIENSILGDNVIVASGCKFEPGSRIWPGKTVEANLL